MPNIFEKRLTREETEELIRKHPDQASFLKIAPDKTSIYSRELSDDYASRMVAENPGLFWKIMEPSQAVCLAAVKADPRLLRHMRHEDQTDAVCREAMRHDLEMIGFLLYPAKDECLEAVRQNPAFIHLLSWRHESFKSSRDVMDVFVEAAMKDADFGQDFDELKGWGWTDSFGDRHSFHRLNQTYSEIARECVEKNAGLAPEELRKAAREDAWKRLEDHERAEREAAEELEKARKRILERELSRKQGKGPVRISPRYAKKSRGM